MDNQSNEMSEQVAMSQDDAATQSVVETQESAQDSVSLDETQQSAVQEEQVQLTQDTQVEDETSVGKKKKKKDKKPSDEPKKENKVGAYVKALFKYFNIITVLPFALLMYAIFFASYIVDKGDLFKSNLTWICVIMGIGAAIMIAWFIVTFKKRRVCSFDAFLLIALMICASMIAQCIIFKNFATFDGISIATLVATVAILALLTVRLIMFDPTVQRNHKDKSYKAKNKISMYFTVIFTKYAFFIAMLCVIGALMILILTQSSLFEDFEYVATNTEKAVTLVFAGLAAILMIVGVFIRIVRGRANVIDCMPYMMFLVTIGCLIYCMIEKKVIYMTLYIAIGCAVVGTVWLVLCMYTLLMSNYKMMETNQSQPTTDTTPAEDSTAEPQMSDAQPTEEVMQTDERAEDSTLGVE